MFRIQLPSGCFPGNINVLDEGAHEFLLLHLSGGIVDFIEGQKQVIDVVSCDLS